MREINGDNQSGNRYKVGIEVDTSALQQTNELIDSMTEKAGKLVELLTEVENILSRLTHHGVTP